MKKLLPLILLIVTAINCQGQLSLEHTYKKAATWNFCLGNTGQLMVVDFEVSGESYVAINRCDAVIGIYDLNHQLKRSFTMTTLPTTTPYSTYSDILYFSENLFDADSGIEFMYVKMDSFKTYIFNEDGSVLFVDTGVPLIWINFHLQQYPIYNTPAGTKMILSYQNGDAKVFSLPGTLSTAMLRANEDLIHSISDLSNPRLNFSGE